jgi:hypothetical protein
LVLDGKAGPWLPAGFDIVPQCDGHLDERLAAAFAAVRGPALLIGMDTPQVTPRLLTVGWHGTDAVFGPAAAGGFWALGLRKPDPALLRGVPMSAPATGAIQRAGCSRPGCAPPTCRGYAMWTPQRMPWPRPARHHRAVSPRGPGSLPWS